MIPPNGLLDTATGVVVNTTLKHEGDIAHEFHANLPLLVRGGIKALSKAEDR
jgi:hypothetical protein